jgi:hypothetical protein
MSKLTDSNPHISLMSHLIALGLIRKLSGEHQLEVAHKIIDTMRLEQLSGIDALPQEENTPEVSSAKNSFDFTLTKCPVIYQFMVREVHEIYDFKTEQQDCFALCTDHNRRRYLPDPQTCSFLSELADRNEYCVTVYLLYILSLLILVTFHRYLWTEVITMYTLCERSIIWPMYRQLFPFYHRDSSKHYSLISKKTH